MIIRALLAAFLSTSIVSLVGEEAESDKPRPAVTKVGEHKYRLGQIEFHAKEREISLPVTVNMREGGPIEYLLVHENGKTHESVFTTEVSPLHLQIVMKLLKFQPGNGDVFNRLLPPEALENEGGEEADRGDLLRVRFLEEGKEGVTPASSVILDGENSKPMSDGPWVYTGSKLEGGTFLAEGEGSIIAIYLDSIAMFNMTRDGADNDERWGANHAAIPEVGVRGMLVLSPEKK